MRRVWRVVLETGPLSVFLYHGLGSSVTLYEIAATLHIPLWRPSVARLTRVVIHGLPHAGAG